MSVGGLAISPKRAIKVTEELIAIRNDYGIDSEVQWKSAKKRRDNIYKAYIDILHSLVSNKEAHLHIRLTPVKGRRCTPEVVSKAFYQLILHRAGRYYHPTSTIHVRPDNGCCTEYLPKLLLGMNGDITRKFDCNYSVVRTIQPCNSEKEHLLQLVDVTLGALTSARNGCHENGGVGEFKRSLILHALDKFEIKDIKSSHHKDARLFNIWNVTPKD